MKLSSSGDKSSPSIKSGRGRKPNPLMEKLVRKEYSANGKVSRWYCIATGCTHHGSNAPASARVLKHSTECLLLKNESPDLYEQACQESAENSLSSRLDQSLSVGSSSKSLNMTGQQRLDVVALKKAGKKRKEEELENLRLVVDLIIVQLICTRGLVPNILDSEEWHELMHALNCDYTPPSSTTFTENYIPKESAYIKNAQLNLLHESSNLTLTFDGTTTRKTESAYTAHASTPMRHSYFVGSYEGSGERHTAEWISKKLLEVRSRSFKNVSH